MSIKKVIINPGHGGNDSGAVSYSGFKEADLTHVISHRVESLLANYFEVYNTRDWRRVELKEVVDFANEKKADIFVSIHCNAYKESNVKGLECFYFPGSEQGFKLADSIYWSIASAAINSGYVYTLRKVKTDEFYVLRKTVMPAVLIETGFITNPDEERWLTSPIGQVTLGFGIARGVIRYFEQKS